jgi:hypothetical protein
MKSIYIFSFLFLGLTLSSCKSTYYGGYAATPGISVGYNIKADLRIDSSNVLQATSTSTVYFGLIRLGDNTYSDAFGNGVGAREKSAATYKALEGTGNDIIINPKYVVKVRNGLFVDQIEATVAGYGAKVILWNQH